VSNALTKQTSKKVGGFIEAQKDQIFAMIPKHANPDRLMRTALQAIQQSPTIAKCSTSSLFTCIVRGSMMGIELNGSLGEGYIVPYGQEATLVIGYRGLINLARRSGFVTEIYAHVVHENDDFEFELGTDKHIKHRPTFKDPGEKIGVYAVYKTKDGVTDFEFMSAEEVEKVRSMSRSGSKPSSPWMQWTDEMWKKTAIRRLSKRMPMSVEMAQDFVDAVAIDNKTAVGETIDIAAQVVECGSVEIPEDEDLNAAIHNSEDPTRGAS